MPVYYDLPTSFHSKDNELYMKGEMIRISLSAAPSSNSAPQHLYQSSSTPKERRAMSDRKPPCLKTKLRAQRQVANPRLQT